MQTHTTGRWWEDHRGGDGHITMKAEMQGDACLGHGMPRIAGGHQRLEAARKGTPEQVSEGAWPADTSVLDFHLPELRQYISAV